MKKLLFLLLLFPILGNAQTKEETYEVFENLIGGLWHLNTKFENGQPFVQDFEMEWGLNKAIIKVKTYGVIDQETREFGLRNEGIRAWDAKQGKMVFHEFDIYGGITSGIVVIEGDVINYEYHYDVAGKDNVYRDTLIPIDKNSYRYEMSMRTNDGWKILLSAVMKRMK